MADDLDSYAESIRACKLCRNKMQRAPNPILQVRETARILVASQAPGNLADLSGVPFNDPSGKRLREWMRVTEAEFYDSERVAIAPMGFCFPGYDSNGGDIPPMKICAKTWRAGLMARLPNIKVTLLIGSYAQRWHLGERVSKTLTETVSRWTDFTSEQLFTTPHPSWRNTAWLKRNPWFEAETLPALQKAVRLALDG